MQSNIATKHNRDNSTHEIIGQWEVSIKLNDSTIKEGD
jgi:hypothetical protein